MVLPDHAIDRGGIGILDGRDDRSGSRFPGEPDAFHQRPTLMSLADGRVPRRPAIDAGDEFPGPLHRCMHLPGHSRHDRSPLVDRHYSMDLSPGSYQIM